MTLISLKSLTIPPGESEEERERRRENFIISLSAKNFAKVGGRGGGQSGV